MNIEKIFDVIVKLATVGSALFVAYQAALLKEQAVLLKKDYNLRNDKAETEKAIELAKFYEEKILRNNIPYISCVFKDASIEDMISCIKYTQLIEFDESEIDSILGQEKIDEFTNKIENIDLEILINGNNILNEVSLNQFLNNLKIIRIDNIINDESKEQTAAEKNDENEEIDTDNDDIRKEIEEENDIYKYYEFKNRTQFISTIEDTLNLLEYFCMNFNSGIADESVVYQSLHQSFLAVIKMLYYFIATQNKTGKDKYYTNIIKLYNKWSKRYNRQQEIEIASKRMSTYDNEPVKR